MITPENNTANTLHAHPNEIRTVTGKYIDIFNLSVDDLDLESIAIGCANEARWGGQTKVFWSVAEHCIMVSKLVPIEYGMEALLHDASEGLGLRDMPSPIKAAMPEYKRIEHGVMKVVAEKFGFNWPISDIVKRVDKIMLEWEWEGLMLGKREMIERPKQQVIDEFIHLAHLYAGSARRNTE